MSVSYECAINGKHLNLTNGTAKPVLVISREDDGTFQISGAVEKKCAEADDVFFAINPTPPGWDAKDWREAKKPMTSHLRKFLG